MTAMSNTGNADDAHKTADRVVRRERRRSPRVRRTMKAIHDAVVETYSRLARVYDDPSNVASC